MVVPQYHTQGIEEVHLGYLGDASAPYVVLFERYGSTSLSLMKNNYPTFQKFCSSVEVAKLMAEILCPY